MNIKALITTLVLGSASLAPSLAMASPSWSGGVKVTATSDRYRGPEVRDHRGEQPQPQPVVRDHRDGYDRDGHDRDHDRGQESSRDRDRDDGRYGWRSLWTALTSPMQFDHEKNFVNVSGRFSRLQLRADAGRTRIFELVIVYGNGEQQVVRPFVLLDESHPTYTVGLEASPIVQIKAFGSSGPGSAYSILAS